MGYLSNQWFYNKAKSSPTEMNRGHKIMEQVEA